MKAFTAIFNPYKYHGIFTEIHRSIAANIICNHWRRVRYNPRYKMNNKIELDGLDQICREENVKIDETNYKFLKEFRLNLRKKDFQRDLKKTKEFLKYQENIRSNIALKNRVFIKAKRRYK